MLQESILQYYRPSLGYHLSLRPLICLLLSGRLRQVLLYEMLVSVTIFRCHASTWSVIIGEVIWINCVTYIPVHEILVLIEHAQTPLLNAHAGVSSRDKDLVCVSNYQGHTYVYANTLLRTTWRCKYMVFIYSKTRLKPPLKNRQKTILMTNGSLMEVESIAKWAFCNTFDLH